MFSTRNECPVCHTAVTDWAARCPKCRYHPDCDPQPYNRAQDDVALIARYGSDRKPSPAAPVGEWRRRLPSLFRWPTVA